MAIFGRWYHNIGNSSGPYSRQWRTVQCQPLAVMQKVDFERPQIAGQDLLGT